MARKTPRLGRCRARARRLPSGGPLVRAQPLTVVFGGRGVRPPAEHDGPRDRRQDEDDRAQDHADRRGLLADEEEQAVGRDEEDDELDGQRQQGQGEPGGDQRADSAAGHAHERRAQTRSQIRIAARTSTLSMAVSSSAMHVGQDLLTCVESGRTTTAKDRTCPGQGSVNVRIQHGQRSSECVRPSAQLAPTGVGMCGNARGIPHRPR